MLVPGSVNPLLLTSAAGAAAGGISRSLRFNSADSAYLSRTPASAGNRRTWTWAGWVKRSGLGGDQQLIYAAPSSTDTSHIRFDDDNTLHVFEYTTGFVWQVKTSQVFRDTSSWYHIVVSVDTTQATASNRVKIYVNGTQVTAFGTATYPSQNADTEFNNTVGHAIGRNDQGASNYFSGYLADIYFIDGQALTPSSFTETDATTGQLIPKAFTGSYGTNGFHLEFSDNSGTTSTTLGKDSAGSNNWTPNNFSVSSGAGNDSLVDVPTNGSQTDTGVGGEVRGNYCTLNPLSTTAGTYTQGNLRYEGANADRRTNGTIAVSTGKWYWEVTLGNAPALPRVSGGQYNAFGFGLSTVFNSTTGPTTQTDAVVLMDNGYYKNFSGSNTDGGTAFSSGDVLSIAVDLDANTFTFRRNNTQIATGTIGGTAGRELVPCVISYNGAYGVMDCNFGQRAFAYTAPSGFKALCTANLPAPLVTKPSTVMDVVTYTGNGSTKSISNLGFSPDFVWLKRRNLAASHNLFDIIRGATKFLGSDGTNAEQTGSDRLTSFDSAGFTLGANAEVNNNNDTYVGWCWDAGSSTVTNTQGSITSSVRANATAGFSIVTYTGSNSVSTVGHGLGVKPGMFVVKRRTDSGYGWICYHSALGASKMMAWQNTSAAALDFDPWNQTEPTSSVFTVNTTGSGTVNAASKDYVAYCFAPVVGYSSFGSYTGNGSSDGPFVYTGFRPRFLMIKRTDSTGSWYIMDTARDAYNYANLHLYPNASSAEAASSHYTDILSNGFKARGSATDLNGSGGTYIYAAFAESPFNYARAR